MFEVAKQHFGIIDIVCPGAGVFEPPFSAFWYPPGSPPSKDDPFGDRYKSLDIDLTHPIRTTQLAVSHFLASSPPSSLENRKTIVHIASTAAIVTGLPIPLYTAAKFGLRGFIYSLADMESAYGIRVSGVAPAAVRTPLFLDHEDKKKLVMVDGKEQKEWVTPEEVAETMFAIVTRDEIVAASGEKIALKGGSLIEICKGMISDVPIFGTKPPGSSGGGAAAIANIGEYYAQVHGSLKKPGWGTF